MEALRHSGMPEGTPATIVDKIVDRIRRQVEAGELAIGEKLPSLRDYARLAGCAKNTVVSAYEALVAEGVVEPRRGAGYFVAGAPRRVQLDTLAPALARALGAVGIRRLPTDTLSLAEGLPPSEWLAACRLDRYMQKIGRAGLGSAFRYGDPAGYLPLRRHIAARLHAQGIDANAAQIILTSGAYQAVDIIIRCYVRPGDEVLVDVPGFHPTYAKLRLQGARLVGIPRTPDGPDVVALRHAVASGKPKLFFTQSICHNPTGSDISADVARATVALARESGLVLVDDDALSDFKPANTRRLAAVDQLSHTLHVGSFSKSLSSIVRVGFIACTPQRAEHLTDIKTILSLNSSQYAERAVDAVITEGRFNRHVAHLQDRVRKATALGKDTLHELGATLFCEPEASLFLWARLPGVDDSVAFAQALQASSGIVLAPGSIFMPEAAAPCPWFRFNVGFMNEPRLIIDAVRRHLPAP